MDTIEVKMQPPTKRPAGGDDNSSGRRGKRQATTSPRLTRSMLKKLNQNGGPPVELDPGIDTWARRRIPGTRPPKRAAQDEAVGASVKRHSTARGGRPAPQPAAQQPGERQPEDQQERFSEASVVAASQLAQAAITAGLLTVKTPEAITPVVEAPPDLVRFTRKDLGDILGEAVADDGIRHKMEPHWLARTEFLTWWERPAADKAHIQEQVRRLAIRWSKDLQIQNAEDPDVPISILESWRADTVIVGGSGEATDRQEAGNEGEKAGDEKKADKKIEGGRDGDDEEDKSQGGDDQAAKEQDDEKGGGEKVFDNGREVAEELAGSLALTKREMAEWKEAFDKEISAEPNFSSKRAWTARVSESQREATTLEERALKLDVSRSERATKSTMQAAGQFLDELQKFRVRLRMDREAFWDEFDQEGAQLLLETTESDQSEEEEIQQQAQHTQQGEAQDVDAEKEDIQMTEIEAEVEDAHKTEVEELRGSSTGDGGVLGVKPGPVEQSSEVKNDDKDDLKPTIVRIEHALQEKNAQEVVPSPQHHQHIRPCSTPTTDVEGNNDVPKTYKTSAAETHEDEVIIPTREEEESRSEAEPTVNHELKDREGQGAEGGERTDSREPTPWLPDKRGSVHNPSWEWPGHQKEDPQAIQLGVTTAVQEYDEPSPEADRDSASSLFSSRSASAEVVSNEEEHATDQALAGFSVTGVRQDTCPITSSIQPGSVEEVSSELKGISDQTLTTSDMTGSPRDRSSVASTACSAGPEIIAGEVEHTADTSSTASNISSLPEDINSPAPGQSGVAVAETVEEIDIEVTVSTASAVPNITSLPEDTDASKSGVWIGSAGENGGRTDSTADSTSPPSHIASLIQELSLPQDTISSVADVPGPSRNVGGEPEEPGGQAPASDQAHDRRPTTPGIRSGSDKGVRGEVEATADGHAAATSDLAGRLPQGGSAEEEPDAPPAISAGGDPSVVTALRYIRPQWEGLFSPEEPTYGASDYSANEIDWEDWEGEELDEADDRETDDVDP